MGRMHQNPAAYQVSAQAVQQWEVFKDVDIELLQDLRAFYVFHSQPHLGCAGGKGSFIITADDDVMVLGHNCSNINIFGIGKDNPNYRQDDIVLPVRNDCLSQRNIVRMSIGSLVGGAVTECGSLLWWGQCNAGSEIKPAHLLNSNGRKYVNVACGYKMMAALSECRKVHIWGQAFNGGYYFRGENLYIGSHVEDISCGLHHLAALSIDGSVYTWGKDDKGQRGQDLVNPGDEFAVTRLNIEPCTSVKCGPLSTFCLTIFHEARACGTNNDFYLGTLDNRRIIRNISRIVLRDPISDLAVVWSQDNQSNMAAVTSSGEIYTWGISKYPTAVRSTSFIDVFSNWEYTPGLIRIRRPGQCKPIQPIPAIFKPINVAEVLNHLYHRDRAESISDITQLQTDLDALYLNSIPKELTSQEDGKGYILTKFLADVFQQEQIPPKAVDTQILSDVTCVCGLKNQKYEEFSEPSFHSSLCFIVDY